jgi:hypothetical protein
MNIVLPARRLLGTAAVSVVGQATVGFIPPSQPSKTSNKMTVLGSLSRQDEDLLDACHL